MKRHLFCFPRKFPHSLPDTAGICRKGCQFRQDSPTRRQTSRRRLICDGRVIGNPHQFVGCALRKGKVRLDHFPKLAIREFTPRFAGASSSGCVGRKARYTRLLPALNRHCPDDLQVCGDHTPYHRRGNGIPSAAIRWPDFGDQPLVGRPVGQICRHSDTPLLSFSPRRRCPRPTPERVLVADHQSGSGFSGTVPSAPPPRPIGR